MGLVLSILGLAGVVNIITRSFLFEGLRNKVPAKWKSIRYLVQCPACMGTWVGFFYYIFMVCDYSSLGCFVNLFVFGGLVSLVSAFLVTLLDALSYQKQVIANRLISFSTGENEEGGEDA